MKKIISVIIILVMLTSLFSGCSGTAQGENGKLSIVTTIFPEYDWVMNILGEKAADADVTMLLDNGVDLHSFQPTADDIIKISNCDLFIYIGGESDEWVEDALKTVKNENMISLNLMQLLGDRVKEEEEVEGMQEEEHGHEHGEDEEHEEYDEHIWLSLKNASGACGIITDALCEADEENAETYKANLLEYTVKLNTLDEQYKNVVENASKKTVIFGDRFPFRYLFDDYGLEYFAAFKGCSAESEASFETISFLAEKTDELGLGCVMTLEGTDGKIAKTVIENTKSKNAKILSMNSMQSVTAADVENNASYLEITEKNLEVLKTALS